MFNKKCCIIYWGLIRGFKYDWVYESHKKHIYDMLKKNNINFDIYIVTNNVDYDDNNIKKLENVKLIEILDINQIKNSNLYHLLKNNFNFHSHFVEESKDYLSVCLYNRKNIMKHIPNNYDFYISLDIQHEIENFDFLPYLKDDIALTSSFGSQLGMNPRVLISNYNNINIYNNLSDYAIQGHYHHNPECMILEWLKLNNINLKMIPEIIIHRIRSCGLKLKDC